MTTDPVPDDDGHRPEGEGHDGWVTVESAPLWHVELLRTLLEEEGIRVYLPDRTTKLVDPFITGANPLYARLQVPASERARAEEVLAAARRSLADAPSGTFDDGEDQDAEEEDEEVTATPGDDDAAAASADVAGAPDGRDSAADVEWLARRTRWAALLLFAFPFALIGGYLYLRAVRSSGHRSSSHGLTLAALALAVLELAVALVLLGTLAARVAEWRG